MQTRRNNPVDQNTFDNMRKAVNREVLVRFKIPSRSFTEDGILSKGLTARGILKDVRDFEVVVLDGKDCNLPLALNFLDQNTRPFSIEFSSPQRRRRSDTPDKSISFVDEHMAITRIRLVNTFSYESMYLYINPAIDSIFDPLLFNGSGGKLDLAMVYDLRVQSFGKTIAERLRSADLRREQHNPSRDANRRIEQLLRLGG